ncbi:hypothetical protein [Mycolicibacterium hippocampi]|uniref:hypothetical protein n=1 Tax=Mycolicibacterium hippocampi TaxID=659824 RepID=UPI003514356F
MSVIVGNTVPSVAAPPKTSGETTGRHGASMANTGTINPLLPILEVSTDDFLRSAVRFHSCAEQQR